MLSTVFAIIRRNNKGVKFEHFASSSILLFFEVAFLTAIVRRSNVSDMTETDQARTAQDRPQLPRWYRWMMLVLISMAMFGNYCIYDSISPLADVLKAQLDFSDSNIGLLNAIYSIPNVFMVLIGGFIIDRLGRRRSTLIFAALCLLGAVVTVWTAPLEVMAARRLIFGPGAESLIVAVTTAIAKWFKGKELSFAFGMNLTIARLGSFAALNSPTRASPHYDHWQWPLFISVAAGVICVAGAIICRILEQSAEKSYEIGQPEQPTKLCLPKLQKLSSFHCWADKGIAKRRTRKKEPIVFIPAPRFVLVRYPIASAVCRGRLFPIASPSLVRIDLTRSPHRESSSHPAGTALSNWLH
jgi:MFS family permease